MITLESCPNCGSYNMSEYRIVPGGGLIIEITPGIKVNASIITRYCLCKDCNLIFQNPRMSDSELDIYYGSGFYRRTINPPPEGMDKGEENRAKIDAEIINKQIGKVKSHLDIGCGLGYLLEKVGADLKVGVESDINYVKVKGIEVYKDMNQVPYKKFDLVTSAHSLEHVPHPLGYLKSMAKFVGKGGYMVIEVPSWKTRGGPLGFAHLSHFEPDVLKDMCTQVGLKVTHMEFTPHLILIAKPEGRPTN
jgi:SAM-dependent methyltransferase